MEPYNTNHDAVEDLAAKWESLDITSNFIFYRVMRDNEDLCLELLQVIFPDLNIRGIAYHTVEKTIDETLDSHGVRLDVFVQEAGEDRMYNIEMQAGLSDDLKKRSRYNQAMVDQEYLDKGHHYSELRDSYIVFICTFDLFERNQCKYSFTYQCVEENDLLLNDGTTRVFLNTRGAREKASPRLAAFLDYCAGVASDDAFVKRLDDAVNIIKKDKEARHRYMTVEMMLRGERLKAKEALAEKDAVIESLEQANSSLSQEISSLSQTNSSLSQEISSLTIENSSLTQANSTLTQEKLAWEKERSDLLTQLEKFKSEQK